MPQESDTDPLAPVPPAPVDPSDSELEVVVVPRTHDLGDGFEVRRALPSTQCRMVGPFVFFDQMGPAAFAPGKGLDVRPHPHIGLSTVTYLFDGEIMHRDSVGSVQGIRPGDVNWMTAGRGIVHSERSPAGQRTVGAALSGLQCWVAVPREREEDEPSFTHTPAAALPVEEGEGVTARLIVGDLFGKRSPVATASPMFYADLALLPGARIDLPAAYAERAFYVVSGAVDLRRDGRFEAGRLVVLKPGAVITLQGDAGTGARVMLLGGEPLDGPRFLAWNFVSSSAERIEQAKDDWRNQRFPAVPEETEFIPLPQTPGKPVHYP